MNKTYKLLLVNPKQKFFSYPAHIEMSKMFGKKNLMLPLALPTIAALTPDNYEIKLIDESIDDLPQNYKPDIVGISTLGASVSRGLEIADMYRSQGVKIVFGGPYASFHTEKMLEHGDCVVVGEAEDIWEICLRDFEKGNLKKLYKAENNCEFKRAHSPRWDLIDTSRIFQLCVQTTRGCPFRCEFCLVSSLYGKKMRYREIDDIIEEIKALPLKYIFFVDDNLTINKKHAKELMKKLKPLGISWSCMSSIEVAKDDELLREMADAGCYSMLMGFESLNALSLKETKKSHNKDAEIYEDAIKKIHAHGINIIASFVVGFDNDTLDEFDKIFDFTLKTGLANINLHLLSAPAGTELFTRMKKEGRLFDSSLDIGVGFIPTMHFVNMSQIDLFDKYFETIEKLYSFDTIRKKAKVLFENGTFIRQGAKISSSLKFRLSKVLIKEYILTKDKDKRLLFKYFVSLFLKNKIAIDKAFSFLITMLSSHKHIKAQRENIDEYRNIVLANDRGPWKEFKTKLKDQSPARHTLY